MFDPVFRNIVLNLLGGSAALTASLANIIVYILGAATAVSMVVIVIMTPWDFLVWLFNADWRTTEFKASLYSLAVLFGGLILVGPFVLTRNWLRRFEDWCDRNVISI
jgi:hypothetical protein